jgi:methionyl-tRNA synthetase
MGIDALRYFLLREIVFGQDGAFSYDALVGRYNSDLANGLGNLVSRTLSMVEQYRGGTVPAPSSGTPEQVAAAAREAIAAARRQLDSFEFSKALEGVWSLLSVADKFIVEQAPWKLIKSADPAAQATLDSTLYSAAEVVRIASVLLAPMLPASCAKIWKQLGILAPLEEQRIDQLDWGQFPLGQPIGKAEAVFPRIDGKPAIEKMRELEVAETARQQRLLGRKPEPAGEPAATMNYITIDDLMKVDLRVAQVVSAEPVKGADKLLQLKVDTGESAPRTIIAGIAQQYTPEQMIGRKIVIVANLAPRKLRGVESQGMLLAASLEGGNPVLAGFLEDVPVGARLK